MRRLCKALSAALIGAAIALLALSGAGAEYRLALHPTTGECVYLNTAGAFNAAGEQVYTPAQARDAETCALPAPPPAAADSAADLAADREGLVGVVRAVSTTTVTTRLTAHGLALQNAEAAVADFKNQLTKKQAELAALSPSAPNFVRMILTTTINSLRQSVVRAEETLAGLVEASAGEPRTITTVSRAATQYVEIDSDGDGVWETHNCAGREVGGRVLPVGVDDDGNDLPYADELRRVCGVG